MDNYFAKLAATNVNDHIEKKNGLSYLSWAWAVDQLLRADPTANWEYVGPTVMPDGTMLVHCAVTAFGITRRMQLPVMDYRNNAIANPDAFAVNTAMQRCLVKAVALHGLGLYIYAGEDIPSSGGGDEVPKPTDLQPRAPVSALPGGTPASAAQLRYIRGLIKETSADEQKVLDYFGITKLEELTSQTASRAIKSLEQRRKAA